MGMLAAAATTAAPTEAMALPAEATALLAVTPHPDTVVLPAGRTGDAAVIRLRTPEATAAVTAQGPAGASTAREVRTEGIVKLKAVQEGKRRRQAAFFLPVQRGTDSRLGKRQRRTDYQVSTRVLEFAATNGVAVLS